MDIIEKDKQRRVVAVGLCRADIDEVIKFEKDLNSLLMNFRKKLIMQKRCEKI